MPSKYVLRLLQAIITDFLGFIRTRHSWALTCSTSALHGRDWLLFLLFARRTCSGLCSQRLRLLILLRSYKPDVSLSFIVNELAFQGEEEDPDHGARVCVQFICDHGGEHLISQRDDGVVSFLTGQAKTIFEDAKNAAFKHIDIKGQI